jgi:hypothetical protein
MQCDHIVAQVTKGFGARLQRDGTCAEDDSRECAAGFCVGAARNGLTHVPLHSPPSRRFVPSHSNRALNTQRVYGNKSNQKSSVR